MTSVTVCHACDLVHRGEAAPVLTATRCCRCRAPLHRPQSARLDSAIALALTALVLFALGNAYPIVSLRMNGTSRSTTLFESALGLFQQGFPALSIVVVLTTVVAPLLQILSLLYLLVPLRRGRRARYQRVVFRLLTHIRPWTFIEVFMLGAIVALVRLAKFAQVIPGIALACIALFMMALAALTSLTTPHQFWHWVDRSRA
jgi:paraquat-inducible protein A